MNKVKLLVCYHKQSYLLKDEVLVPIHVGRALAEKKMDHNGENYKWLINNLVGDNTGENISHKNGSYNEMTSLYWAWKNYQELGDPEYVGLMHYRRHFINRPGEIDVVHFDDIDEEHYFEEINYSPEKMSELVDGCDFVAHIGKVNNVYKHYLENHRQEDLDMAFQIMYDVYPEYKEIAKEYFAGDLSNFCNMFIFKKEIFFDYCKWIFSILEEFEKKVDISEKRLFISERLTGVYIAKLMKDESLKYKVVPISFVAENVNVPIVMPYDKSKEFQLATTITSLLVNKKKESSYTIYLLHSSEITEVDKEKYNFFVRKYHNVKIIFVRTEMEEEYYPIVLADLFPKLNKCIYLNEDVLILKDLVEFYRTCSTDDYYVVGIPTGDYNIYEKNKKVQLNCLVMNLAKLRQRKLSAVVETDIYARRDTGELFNNLCRDTIGYVPWYYANVSSHNSTGIQLFDKEKTRGWLQGEAAWKQLLVYDTNKPWIDMQGTYSLFWWEMAAKVPVIFKFCRNNERIIGANFANQQIEINNVGFSIHNPRSHGENGNKAHSEETEVVVYNQHEEWRNYSLLGKLKFYYEHNGLKKTVVYCWKKYIIREN